MKDKKASYLDEIGAVREAVGYDQPQVGKPHEEEVASSNNWEGDQRDAVGRAASIANRKKRLAKKLMRISRELEALGKMEEAYKAGVEEMADDEDDFDDDDNGGDDDAMAVEMGTEEWLDPTGKEAAHPIEHDPNKDDPAAFSPSTMGDDEWISIGPGSFDDKRDQVGRAA
jgi:hypothetical protein